jgi:hypothetical protein
VYLFALVLSFDRMQDDAYIYFRAAENIASGHGYVFNRGGEHIEVGSSNLWLLILVLIDLFPINLELGAQFLGVASSLAALCITYVLCYRLTLDRFLSTFASAASALSSSFLFWSHRGLETPLQAFLLVALVLITIDRSAIKFWPWIVGLMLLGRPETPLFLLGIVPALWLNRVQLRSLLLPAACVLGFALLLELFRLLYFDDLLPQPPYLKLGLNSTSGIQHILKFFGPWYYLAFVVPVLLAAFRPSFWSRPFAILLVYTCLALAWPILSPDPRPYFRFVAPAVPLVWVTLMYGLHRALPPALPALRVAARAYCGLVTVVYVLFASLSADGIKADAPPLIRALDKFARQPVGFSRQFVALFMQPHGTTPSNYSFYGTAAKSYQWPVGEFLAENYPRGITVVYDQMGQTPYRAGHDKWFIDSYGLTDRTIGHHTFLTREPLGFPWNVYRRIFAAWIAPDPTDSFDLSNRADVLDALFARKPQLVLINTFVVLVKPESLTATLASDPRLASDYEYAFLLGGVVQVFERKGFRRLSDPVHVPDNLVVVDARSQIGLE